MACPRAGYLGAKDPGLKGTAGKGVQWLWRLTPLCRGAVRFSWHEPICHLVLLLQFYMCPVWCLPRSASGEPVAPACGWCAFTATVWAACKYGSSAPISPIPCTAGSCCSAGSCSPFSKELKLLLLQLHAQMLLWPLAGMQEHGCFTCKQLLSLRSTKITGWTLQCVTQPARTPGESVQTTWCWPCVCKGSSGQRAWLTQTQPGRCKWFFTASAITKWQKGWGWQFVL